MKTKNLIFGLLVCISHLAFGQWAKVGNDIDGQRNSEQAGRSVSMSADGRRVAVGGAFNDIVNEPGYVRIYEISGTDWSQLGLEIGGEADFDRFGYSVSLSADGSRVAVGAPYNDGTGANAGRVRIYEYDGNDWVQLGSDIDGEAAGDRSGWSVSLSADGSRVAIGAPYNDGNGADSGHVRVYELGGAIWQQVGSDLDGEAAGDRAGTSVSLDGNGDRVAIGAPYNDGNGANAGHVRVYELGGGAIWGLLDSDIDGENPGDQAGTSVSLNANGTRVAIGAPYNDGNGINSGHVRVYQLILGMWDQVGSDIDGEAANDWSGFSVSLNAFGNRVAIGAPYNDEHGNNSGHVRVYQLIFGTWDQEGSDIDGEAVNDWSAWSVSLNEDGDRVAIGGILNDGNGGSSGHVRVYGDSNLDSNGLSVGAGSGQQITSGERNTFFGNYSGFNTTTGSLNTFIGHQSGYNTTTGDGNVAVGRRSLFSNDTGSNNIAIGNNSGTTIDNLNNTIAIGSNTFVSGSNQVRIGNFEVENILGAAVWSVVSDGRFKINVEEDVAGLDFIKALRPVSYNLDRRKIRAFTGNTRATNTDVSKKTIGFIAQEVAQLVEEHKYMFTGVKTPENEKDHYGLKYAEFVVPLVKAVQEQQQLIEGLQQENEALKERMEALENPVNSSLPGGAFLQGKDAGVQAEGFALYQNTPNPFNRTTRITALIPDAVQEARIVIYNLQGLELESYAIPGRGNISLEISGGHFPSGIYLYALLADDRVIDTKKMILTR